MYRFVVRVKNAVFVRIKILKCTIKYIFFRIIPAKNDKKIWVICERGTDARDNGYAFYRYMIEKHPEVQVYYLITSDSADYHKVAEHAVIYGSTENYRVVAKAEKIISTHCYTALSGVPEKVWHMLKIEDRFYFLQHGIIQGKLTFLYGKRSHMKLFCCTAVPEYKYIKENYGHPEGVVQCTGLARYDCLLSFEVKKQILIMPTWRRYLKSKEIFLESEYFKAWDALIKDERLLKYLSDTNTKLVFYPHYEMQAYLECFKTKNENVIIADFNNYDVQQLLKESKLLVTDYSSVYFDFAYMGKPCIYYQFDKEEYNKQHYKEGYFSFEKNGFGSVENEQESLVDQILYIAQMGYKMDSIYKMRIEDFFAFHDNKNCDRIYQAIKSS